MYMSALHTWMPVCHTTWVFGTFKEQKRELNHLELELASCKLRQEFWKSKLGHLKDEPMLSTTKSLSPQGHNLNLWVYMCTSVVYMCCVCLSVHAHAWNLILCTWRLVLYIKVWCLLQSISTYFLNSELSDCQQALQISLSAHPTPPCSIKAGEPCCPKQLSHEHWGSASTFWANSSALEFKLWNLSSLTYYKYHNNNVFKNKKHVEWSYAWWFLPVIIFTG